MISAERKSGSARFGGHPPSCHYGATGRPPLQQKRAVKRRKACAEM